MNYEIVSWDETTRILIIQVSGCSKTTYMDIPADLVYGAPLCMSFIQAIADSIIDCMDPNSENYDPTLTGE